jgi:hypothetical protein
VRSLKLKGVISDHIQVTQVERNKTRTEIQVDCIPNPCSQLLRNAVFNRKNALARAEEFHCGGAVEAGLREKDM